MKKILRSTKIVSLLLGPALLLTACGGNANDSQTDSAAATTAVFPAGDPNAPSATGVPSTTDAPATEPSVTDLPLTPETFPDAAYSFDPYCFDRLIGEYEADAKRLADAILGYETSVTLSAEYAQTVVDNIAFEFPPAALAEFSVEGDTVRVTYLCDRTEHARQIVAFASAVNRALSVLSAEDGEARRATLLYEWVVKNVSYFSTDYTEQEITAFSALVAGESICYGFADAFGYLLRQTGIEAHLWRGGTYTASGFSDHGWCYARIDGAYYHFDPTWEKSVYKVSGILSYRYFGMSDQKRFSSLSGTSVSGFGLLEESCIMTQAPHTLEPKLQ